MMKSVEKFLKVFLDFIIGLLQKVSLSLSFKTRQRLARILGQIIIWLDPKRKKITISNLKSAYPEKSKDWISDIMKKSYQNIAITFLELLALPKFKNENLHNIIKFHNFQIIMKAYSKGKGVLLLSGHFGNWELLAFAAGYFSKIPVLIIIQSQKYGNKYIIQSRTCAGNLVVDMAKSSKKIIETLKNGGVVALLADQSASREQGVYVDFFGRKCSTYKSPAELALKFNIPMIMGFNYRKHDGTYEVEVQEINHSDLEYNKQGIFELTQRHVQALENSIRKSPDLWAWQHKRWKYQHPDDINNYERI